MELTFPQDLSPIAKDMLSKLLSKNPAERLGSGDGDARDIKAHAFFKDVNWPKLLSRSIRPPFVPEVKTSTDVHYFAKEFTEMSPSSEMGKKSGVAMSEFSAWTGFSYTGDHE